MIFSFGLKFEFAGTKERITVTNILIYLGRATIYVLHDLRCLPPLSTTQESTTTTGTRWRTAGRGNVSNSDSISGIVSFAIKFCEQGRDLSTDYLLITGQCWFISSEQVSTCIQDVFGESWINFTKPLFTNEVFSNWGELFFLSYIFAFKSVIYGEKSSTNKIFHLHICLSVGKASVECEFQILQSQEMFSASLEIICLLDEFNDPIERGWLPLDSFSKSTRRIACHTRYEVSESSFNLNNPVIFLCFPCRLRTSGKKILPILILAQMGEDDFTPRGEVVSAERVSGGFEFVGLHSCLESSSHDHSQWERYFKQKNCTVIKKKLWDGSSQSSVESTIRLAGALDSPHTAVHHNIMRSRQVNFIWWSYIMGPEAITNISGKRNIKSYEIIITLLV